MTNDLAYRWAAENMPAGEKVFISPFFVSNFLRLPIKALSFKSVGMSQYRLPESIGPSSERHPLYRPDVVEGFLTEGVSFVVLNSYFEGALYDSEENRRWFPKSVAEYGKFRERLSEEYVPAYSVPGRGEGRLGPDIDIYTVKPSPKSGD